jgi:hypothetical protein
MNHHNQWKAIYYESLSLRHTSLGVALLVMCAHYTACVCPVERHCIGTPFQSLVYSAPIEVEPLPLHEEEDRDYSIGIIDPISFIYEQLVNGPPPVVEEPPATTDPVEVDTDTDTGYSGMIQICVIHAVSLVSFLTLLLPTVYTSFSAKSAAMWTLGSISICCSLASWCVCMYAYSFDTLRKLSMCVCMHLTMQLMNAQASVAEHDPSIPLYMPTWIARGVKVTQGIVLCYIAHSSDALSDFDTLDFYMNHTWGVAIAEVVKHCVIAPIMWLVGMTVTTKLKYE